MASRLLNKLAVFVISLLLTALSVWLVASGIEQRRFSFGKRIYKTPNADAASLYADYYFYYGFQAAEAFLDPAKAAEAYKQAVRRNPLHVDAWVGLANAAVALGDTALASQITHFWMGRLPSVSRWKWSLALLAYELDLDADFAEVANFLIGRKQKLNDVFFLLDTYFDQDAEKALEVLTPANYSLYLEWAMRWKRLEAARKAWSFLPVDAIEEKQLVNYVNFLLDQKEVSAAITAWKAHGHSTGITNGGFEDDISGRGFGWRLSSDRSGRWKIASSAGEGRSGGKGLHLTFMGKENISFYHAFQLVPVKSETLCQLSWWWKSRVLTTDQRPFFEVLEYPSGKVIERGDPVMPTVAQWEQETLDFQPPEGVGAVRIRLRRLPSHRFDSKIRGQVWLDDVDITCDVDRGF